MKHTPGPWKIDTSYATMLVIGSEGGVSIAEVDCAMSMMDFETRIDPIEEEQANANLIAAAPELLNIAERLLTYYEPSETRPEAIFKLDTAREVIAKAKGES